MKALLGFAHKVGFTRFNAAPLIKLRKAPRQLAQRILSEVDVQLLIREARPGRNRLMFEVAYFGGLRVSELSSLTWVQVIPRETGEVQLALVGKGDKERHVLIPAEIAKGLVALRGDAPSSARVFPISGTADQSTDQGGGEAREGQSGGLGTLVSACPRLARDRQRRADHACLADPRPCRLEDDQRLCPRSTERKLEPLSEIAVRFRVHAPHII